MSGRRILVVEDDPDLAEGLSDVLDISGFEAEFVPSCEAGLESLATGAFDVVVMDVDLPGLGGFECLAKLRAAGAEIEVIMMTGYSVTKPLPAGIAEDTVVILHKPFAMSELLALLNGAP